MITIMTCAALILTVMFVPEIKAGRFKVALYPVVAFCGAVLILIFSPLTVGDCVDGILGAGAVNPIKILVLFLSVTAISVFLDESGFFDYLAQKILGRAGTSQKKLYFILYITVSVLTVFTSNDIIILTFTPFIISFCKRAGIKAFPYLMAEFVAANTWSMALVIGNPTNIYLATSANIGFFEYAATMLLPTFFAGSVSAGLLYLLFYKSLGKKIERQAEKNESALKNKPMCVLGGIVLAVCTVSLAISNFIGAEMWLECAVCFILLVIIALVMSLIRRASPRIIVSTLKRLPYALVPFVLSMFVVSLALSKVGVTAAAADLLAKNELLLYGVTSFLASNLVNNIPMSIIYSSIISLGGAGRLAVFASIVGSNLGAILTPIGALAGIMFSSICKRYGEKISAWKFICYGSCVSLVSLAVSLGSLAAVIAFL